MEIKLTNATLQSVADYLPEVKAKGRENRARQKLMKRIAEKHQEFFSDIQDIKADIEDEQKQIDGFSELLKEEVTLDMTEYANLMHALYEYMLDYPHEIDTESKPSKPSDAVTHDYIVDVLEVAVEATQTKNGDDE